VKKDADHLILRITLIKNDLLWGNKKHLHPLGTRAERERERERRAFFSSFSFLAAAILRGLLIESNNFINKRFGLQI